MKVFFINPPRINPLVSSYEMPLGIVALVAALERFQPDIPHEILDFQLHPESNLSVMEGQSHPVACMTILTYNQNIVYNMCRQIKELIPQATVILGGPHATLQKDTVFEECPYVDYVSAGEGEFSLPQLLHQLQQGNRDCSTVPGAFRRDGMRGPDYVRIRDLSVLPSITIGMRHYDIQEVIRRNIYVSYIASRGCPHSCIYCSSSDIWGHHITFVPSQTVCEDLAWLAEQGVEYINFRDDIFTLNKQWLEPVLRQLKKMHIIWGCETRADCVDLDTLTKMKASGCELIRFGVETFNQHTLDVLNKRTNVERVKQSLRWAQEAEISEIRVSMMLGLPGETDEDVRRTLNTCHSFDGVFFKFFSLYPAIGTELYRHLDRYGITMHSDEALIGHSQISTSVMDNQRINEWIRTAYLEFHDPEEDYHRDFSTIFRKKGLRA